MAENAKRASRSGSLTPESRCASSSQALTAAQNSHATHNRRSTRENSRCPAAARFNSHSKAAVVTGKWPTHAFACGLDPMSVGLSCGFGLDCTRYSDLRSYDSVPRRLHGFLDYV